MTKITHDNAFEYEAHKFSAQASDLGWSAGKKWPGILITTLGNGQPFFLAEREVRDGDLWWIDYRQQLGCITLRVFND